MKEHGTGVWSGRSLYLGEGKETVLTTTQTGTERTGRTVSVSRGRNMTESDDLWILVGLVVIVLLVIGSSIVEGSIYESKGFANAGPCSGSIMQYSDTGGSSRPYFGGVVNSSDTYQATSQHFVTLGASGYMRTIESGDTFAGSIDISTDGMLNIFDTGAMEDLQINVPESICDTDDLTSVGGGESGNYPSRQSVEFISGSMSSGPGTRYKSSSEIADTMLTHTAEVQAETGYYYMDLKGDLQYGFDKNSSDQNLGYGVHDHQISSANETAKLKTGFEYTWYGYEYEEEEEETYYTITSISKERLEKYVNETNQTTDI